MHARRPPRVQRPNANAPFPVWAGIGHTGDHSVADDVAHSAWITPTACGEALVTRVAAFWEEVERRTKSVVSLVTSQITSVADRLTAAEIGLRRSARYQVTRRTAEIGQARSSLTRAVVIALRNEGDRTVRRSSDLQSVTHRGLSGATADVARRTQVLGAFDPRRQFERGWSLAHRDGHLIRSAHDLADGEIVVTTFADGDVRARVEEVVVRADDRQSQSE